MWSNAASLATCTRSGRLPARCSLIGSWSNEAGTPDRSGAGGSGSTTGLRPGSSGAPNLAGTSADCAAAAPTCACTLPSSTSVADALTALAAAVAGVTSLRTR